MEVVAIKAVFVELELYIGMQNAIYNDIQLNINFSTHYQNVICD